jgi:hypothetical protein
MDDGYNRYDRHDTHHGHDGHDSHGTHHGHDGHDSHDTHDDHARTEVTRREMLETMSKAAAASLVALPIVESAVGAVSLDAAPLTAIAGVDRITLLPGKTYLNAWAGYGDPPRRAPRRPAPGAPPPPPPEPPGPTPTSAWSKESGPGTVSFADATSPVTTATFSAPGLYVLKLTLDNGQTRAASTLNVKVVPEPAVAGMEPIHTKGYRIDSPLWGRTAKVLTANWIPHCIDQINRTDLELGPGGIDNFVEAARALAGQPHGAHKGYVFSNAWVHQTVEAMSIALMVDPKGDKEILAAHAKMRATLEDWIPKILAAQEPDGYLQTAFTLRNPERWAERWSAQGRGNHEGYVAGYFLESAINHYMMTNRADARLYNAARKLADCWCDNLGPAPKKEWFDGHQEMEQALGRFGRFVNEMEGGGKGDRYIRLARFLLDGRKGGTEYDQSHLPVVQQYEAVGHAVRAVYTYSGMADIALETRDVDYQSAVLSIWDNVVNRKYYVTGGVGSGETSEGFGPDYSLRNAAYCESCSSCGEIFFQWKLNLAYGDAKYADLYEETLYNALLGSLDLEGRNFYYDNPLDSNVPRAPWHVCPCCVGNIARTLLMLPTWMYARGTDSICVNLFAGSAVTVEDVAGTDVQIVQATDYPWNGKVSLTVNPRASKRFSLRIRVPNRNVSELYVRTPAANGIGPLRVNGSVVKPVMEKGYAVITRAWKAGDVVDFVLPLTVQRVRASDRIAATKGRVALQYGPLIYNIEKIDQDITQALASGAPLTTEWRPDLLGGVMTIRGTFADGSRLMAIPNFARYNRNPPVVTAPPPVPATPGAAAVRPPRPPATSIIWMKEP